MRRFFIGAFGLIAIAIIAFATFAYWSQTNLMRTVKDAPADRIIGNPQASLTIVEFVDYRCPYCLIMHQRLLEAIKEEGADDIRIVIRPLPWLDEDSGPMATLVVAAGQQGKEIALHKALLEQEKPQSYEAAKVIAQGLGVDLAKAETAQKDHEVIAQVTENLKYAFALNLKTIPALLIGDTLYVATVDQMPTVNQIRILIQEEKTRMSK